MPKYMVIAFENIDDADRALTEIVRPRRERLIELEDAIVATRDANGKLHLKRHAYPAEAGGASDEFQGAMWGALVALPFLSPLVGMVTGAALDTNSGATSGKHKADRLNDEFIRTVGETLPSNTSALFVLILEEQAEMLMAEISLRFRGQVIRSSFSPEQEARLNSAFSGGAVAVPETAKDVGDPATISSSLNRS